MKFTELVIANVFIVSKLMGMDDGLYDVSDAANPRLLDGQVGTVKITSESNDNTRYSVQIRAVHGFSPPFEQMRLVISNQTVRLNGYGQEGGNGITVLDAEITNVEVVPLVAQHLHAAVLDRHHPGHQMLVQFIPAKGEFSTNEPVTVTLRITNVGKRDFKYWQGGSQRGARDNQFAFTAEYPGGKMLPDVGNPLNFGGLSFAVILKPGESHELAVDLRKWFNFTAGGIYQLRGSYAMNFSDPGEKDSDVIWEDFACGRFEIRMKQ